MGSARPLPHGISCAAPLYVLLLPALRSSGPLFLRLLRAHDRLFDVQSFPDFFHGRQRSRPVASGPPWFRCEMCRNLPGELVRMLHQIAFAVIVPMFFPPLPQAAGADDLARLACQHLLGCKYSSPFRHSFK